MSDTSLRDILLLCLSIERTAAGTYRAFSKQAEIVSHKTFWHDISQDEEAHLDYWTKLLDLEKQGKLTNPFDNPIRVKARFEEMKIRVAELLADMKSFHETGSAILFALRLESLMLHPAFFKLFRGLKREAGNYSPEDDYQQHIEKFSHYVVRYHSDREEMVLLADILIQMCEHNREVANQFERIKTLRGLIPICANCKSIRDDKGYWLQVESYLAKHGEAEFTHSICPKCLQKLYPEFVNNPV
jgi:bacterioferritin (cytochrome b1)